MNFLCHVRVALASADDDLLVLGSILPDVESLVGQALGGARPPQITSGIALHKATDAIFHADPRFIAGSIALTNALRERGIGRGASRALGHAGWELLLDGLLVDDARVTRSFAAASEALARLASDTEPSSSNRLLQFATRQRQQPIWAGYAEPAVVADRLQRQLQRRPRLSFPRAQLGDVTDELEGAATRIRADGLSLIDDVARAATS